MARIMHSGLHTHHIPLHQHYILGSAGSLHAPHLILRLGVGAKRQQILHSFPLACLRSLMQRSLPIALHCLAGGALCQCISTAKPLQKETCSCQSFGYDEGHYTIRVACNWQRWAWGEAE